MDATTNIYGHNDKCLWTQQVSMDATTNVYGLSISQLLQYLHPSLSPTPPPERMSQVLDETLGPLPVLAPVRKFKRQPAGHYDASTDVQELFGKRRAANARERHRVQSINGGFSKLKSIVPLIRKDRKPSKVHVLRAASEYIRLLHNVLQEAAAAEEVAAGVQEGERVNVGEVSLPTSRRPSEEIHHLPAGMAAGAGFGFPADGEAPGVWASPAVPCVGIVQLEDGNMILRAAEGLTSTVAVQLALD
ncbi:factor in the germline alpha-like [Hemiscyllium ocellatum]|uniref:factor in the germline alpha-like n=1 Tax=Hemiscyllium ocellatum TaxID=170820 RepID=UPI0029668655|nr:factor in the germline alpha-like [Hemiscyllium ocellatum]